MAEARMGAARSGLAPPLARIAAFLRRHALMSIAIVLAAGFVGLTGWVFWEAREDTRAEAARSSANLVAW